MTRARLARLTTAASRLYLPTAKSRCNSRKICAPGKAQKRSIDPRISSAPVTVSTNCSTGRCWASARANCVVDSSRLDQVSFLSCQRLLYANGLRPTDTVTTSAIWTGARASWPVA